MMRILSEMESADAAAYDSNDAADVSLEVRRPGRQSEGPARPPRPHANICLWAQCGARSSRGKLALT